MIRYGERKVSGFRKEKEDLLDLNQKTNHRVLELLKDRKDLVDALKKYRGVISGYERPSEQHLKVIDPIIERAEDQDT